jgi:hypothetical protein
MLTPAQLSTLTTRSTSPWPSGGLTAWGLRVYYVDKPNPLSGAPVGAFEIHDCAGRYLTWTTDPAVITELVQIESQGFGTVLKVLNGGVYKPDTSKRIALDLDGLQL